MRQLIAGICLCISICFGWNGAPYPCDTDEVKRYLRDYVLPNINGAYLREGLLVPEFVCIEDILQLTIHYKNKTNQTPDQVIKKLAENLVCSSNFIVDTFSNIPTNIKIENGKFLKKEITKEVDLLDYCYNTPKTHISYYSNSNEYLEDKAANICRKDPIKKLARGNTKFDRDYSREPIVECENNKVGLVYYINEIWNLQTPRDYDILRNNRVVVAYDLVCKNPNFKELKIVTNKVNVVFSRGSLSYSAEIDLRKCPSY